MWLQQTDQEGDLERNKERSDGEQIMWGCVVPARTLAFIIGEMGNLERVLSNGVTGSHVHFNRITLDIVLERD